MKIPLARTTHIRGSFVGLTPSAFPRLAIFPIAYKVAMIDAMARN